MVDQNNTIATQLTDRGRASVSDFLEYAVATGLQDAFRATSDFPGFVADPSPVSTTGRVLQGVTRLACRSWARGNPVQGLPGFDAAWGGICEPYLEGLGEYPAPGELGRPFEGGQCAGITYRVAFSGQEYPFSDCSNFGPSSGDIGLAGPILGTVGRVIPPAEASCASFTNISLRHGSPPTETPLLGAGFGATVTSLSVTPESPVPDNCGNPPPSYDPPERIPGLPPIGPVTIDIPGIGPVAVDVSFGEDGEILISLPDLGIDLEIPNPFALPGGGGSGEPANPPGYQGNPGSPTDVGPGEAAEGEDEDRPLLGVLVQTIETPPRANVLFNPTESYTKGAYFVYLGGNAGLTLVDTAAITRPSQFFPAPEGSNRFRVVPNNGFTIRVTPYYDGE